MQVHHANALRRAYAPCSCTDGRTDGLTQNPTHDTAHRLVPNAHEESR